MTNAQALAKLRRLFGKKAHYSIDPKARDADGRAKLQAKLPALRDAREEARKAASDRRLNLLDDPEYQRLIKAAGKAQQAYNTASFWAHTYRINAGRIEMGLFHHVAASGDTWDEVFEKLAEIEKRKAVTA